MRSRALVCGVALLLSGAAWATHSQDEPIPEGQGFHLPDSGAAPSTPAASSASPSSSNGLDVLKRLTQGLAGSKEQPEFLPPDVAFVLSVDAVDADTVVADWQIADGYYLYRSKMRFDISDPEGFAIGDPVLPAGKTKIDEYFGEMEVYYEGVQATLPLQRGDATARDLTLNVVYQGCADAGLCYPPIKKQLKVSLPASQGTPSTQGPASAVELPEQDRIARSLAEGNLWLVMLGFLGLGLLLTFTPCVFPMIPILSSILVGQGESLGTRRAFTLSLTYVLAMAATYTLAGVLAGLLGANLQAAFQNPWILGTFIVVFVLLALSMFGLYDLQIPASWQARLTGTSNRQQRGTYIGVGIMGFLSALIVGPCVAAPLAGALIYIGQTGDAARGGLALFALSIGMGLPVLAVGTSAGKLLPTAGPWMNAVKAVFGVVLLGVAIYLAERLVPAWVALLMWGALLVVTAIYFGALDRLTGEMPAWWRVRKGAALIMLVYGVALVVGGFSGSDNVWRPLERLASGGAAAHQDLEFKRVKGIDGLNTAVSIAVAQGKPIMLDFYADWCVSCKEMERYTFRDADVQAALAGAVLLQTDVTANDAKDQALLKHFNLFGPPAILFFGSDGQERPAYRVVGYMKAPRFREVVEKAIGGKGQLSASSQRQSRTTFGAAAVPSALPAD
jgi:thiol:disulfide interchange protein DsbD